MEIVRINGHNFNADWARSVGEQRFVDVLLPAPFWKDELEKDMKLRRAWRLMNGRPEEEITAAATGAPSGTNEQIPHKRESNKKRGGK